MSWVNRVSWKRSITSYSKIQGLWANVIRNKHFAIQPRRLANKKYLNVGPGPFSEPTCINLDYSWNPNIDICWDITNGVPLETSSVKGIFTEHCIEHISLEANDFVLSEFSRILQPGGTVRIIVPDGELYLRGYVALLENEHEDPLPYAYSDDFFGIYSPMMSVNRIFRAHGHQFIYDFDTLSRLLKRNGFIDIKKESFRMGRNPDLIFDHQSRAVESLYVEASVAKTDDL